MKKNKKLITLFLAAVMMVGVFTLLNTDSVYAKGNKTYYSGNFRGNEKDVDKIGIIAKVKFTKTKMTVTGSLKKGKTEKEVWHEKSKYCKKKKRKFKLSKNVRFYQAGGWAGEIEDTKSEFVEFCEQLNQNPNGLNL